MIVFKYRELRCSNEESLKIIDDLCKNYTDHKLDGNLCDAICYSRNIIFKKCINYRLGKKVLLAECNGICEEGKTITAVIKTRTMEGRHFEPLNLDTYTNKSLTAESMEIAKTVMNSMISSSTLKTYKSVKDIFTKLWTTDFTSFVKNAKYPGADVVAMESLWSLINQDEFLFMSVFQDVPFIPKIYGSCGAYYMTEFAPPGQILSPNFFNAKEGGMWKKRVDIALGILDISSSLDIDFHEPLHFCDVKEENFGINSNNQVKILDTDSLFFDTSMMKDLSEPKCKTHDDCDFFDCRGWCDVKTHECVAKRTNNNIQNICEDIFIPRAVNFHTGLLYNPPAEIATELKQLLEECAYPNKNKGEIVRSPTPINVYWKLISLLKRSKKIS